MRKLFLYLFFGIILSSQIFTQDIKWDFEIFTGYVYNFPSPLKVYQDNFPTLSFNAKYKTDPLKLPPYYDLRIIRWKDDKGWDFEFFHHKIILTNNPPEIYHFSATHGYNIFTLKRVQDYKGFVMHYGGGFVLAHPESVVRNLKMDEQKGLGGKGYYFSGIVAEAALDKRIFIGSCFYMSAETKLTASYSSVPINSGHATIALLTWHAILGIGVEI